MQVTEYVASNHTKVDLSTRIGRVASLSIPTVRHLFRKRRGIPPAATEGTSLSRMNQPPAGFPAQLSLTLS
jgi:hypothetical protein